MEFTFKYGIYLFIWGLPLDMEFTFDMVLPLNMEFTFEYGIYL